MKLSKKVGIGALILGTCIIINSKSMAATATVNTDTLKLRKEASTEAITLELLNIGDKLEVLSVEGDWVKIKVNGMTGYVYKEYVDIAGEVENTPNEEPEQNEETNEEPSNNNDEEPQKQEENTEIKEDTLKEENSNKTAEFKAREDTIKSDAQVYILPLLNATKIEKVNKNTNVMVIDEVNGWAYIETDTSNGWVRKDVLANEQSETNTEETTENQEPQQNAEETTKPEEKQIDKKVMYVNYSSIYVRKEPSTSSEVVDTLVLNNSVNVIAEVEDWYKVEIDGKQGYIAKRLLSNSKQEEDPTSRNSDERPINDEEKNALTNSSANTIGEEIAEFAQEYLNCPYVYGGAGPSSFDCSGFTMYVYKNFGIYLSHSATAQSRNGVYVSKDELEPGDLVFFKDYETMDGIGHVGIYIGDGNFIHASSGTGYCVKISTLLSGSYATRYETARRLV